MNFQAFNSQGMIHLVLFLVLENLYLLHLLPYGLSNAESHLDTIQNVLTLDDLFQTI